MDSPLLPDAVHYSPTVPADPEPNPLVTRVSEGFLASLMKILAPYGLQVVEVADGAGIPGSYWGDPEAGLIGDRLFVRADTPLHSALHEACHYICMDADRRASLHTNAGGDDVEEVAVCYLQVLLADRIAGYSRERVFADMDAWGYNFILGSARAWFHHDAADARRWLERHRLIG
jgi:hypothetical protein